MNATEAIPRDLRVGLRALAAMSGCALEAGPQFEKTEGAWLLRVTLTIGESSELVPRETRWVVQVSAEYPFGEIGFYPAATGGITSTFQHQEFNIGPAKGKDWLTGKICLVPPFKSRSMPAFQNDPVGDGEERLAWHGARACVGSGCGQGFAHPGR